LSQWNSSPACKIRVKLAAKLQDRRARRQQGRFSIHGARELRRALESGVRPEEAFVCPTLADGPDAQTALLLLRQHGGTLFEVTPAVFEKLSYGEREDGIVAVVASWTPSLEKLSLPACPMVAVLEGVEKPGNVGAVLRSADAAGVSALVIADGGPICSIEYHPRDLGLSSPCRPRRPRALRLRLAAE
jgi:TrmH family RNA methyltransferase